MTAFIVALTLTIISTLWTWKVVLPNAVCLGERDQVEHSTIALGLVLPLAGVTWGWIISFGLAIAAVV